MTDTPNPTLDEAYDAASEELTSTEDTPKEESKEVEPSQKPDDSKPESESEDKPEDKPEEPKEEETDFLKVEGDVTKMTPDQLEAVKTKWQSSYTKTRQAEREEIAELKKQLADKEVKPTDTPVEIKPMDQMTPQEYAQHVADMAKAEVSVAADNAYIEAQEKAFYEADPRLNIDNPEHNKDLLDLVVLRLSNEREAHEEEGKPVKSFDFVGRTKKLISAYDEGLTTIKQNYLKKQSEIARTKSEDFAKETPKTSGAKPKKRNMTLDESLDSAFK